MDGFMKFSAVCAVVVLTSGCELAEVTIVEVEPTVVAEVYVQVGGEQFGPSRIVAFLRKTLDGQEALDGAVLGARVVVGSPGLGSIELGAVDEVLCLDLAFSPEFGSCYAYTALGVGTLPFGPGDPVELTIELPGGGRLSSFSTIPADFSVAGVADGLQCELEPDTPMTLSWSESPGTWAYVNETTIQGLRDALAPRGIDVESDTLQLLGLSVSAADTEIVFPAEFGVFDRFDLDQAVATALQEGLPEGSRAAVTIAASDRNYVNWARGGNFNPSGQVRVPSIQGDGTGVFATLVIRGFEAFSGPSAGQTSSLPACPRG